VREVSRLLIPDFTRLCSRNGWHFTSFGHPRSISRGLNSGTPPTAEVAPRPTTGIATETRQCWAFVANSSVRARASPLLLRRDLASSEQLTSEARATVKSFRFWHFGCSEEERCASPLWVSISCRLLARAVDLFHCADIGHAGRRRGFFARPRGCSSLLCKAAPRR
jgi:hypothetical protein